MSALPEQSEEQPSPARICKEKLFPLTISDMVSPEVEDLITTLIGQGVPSIEIMKLLFSYFEDGIHELSIQIWLTETLIHETETQLQVLWNNTKITIRETLSTNEEEQQKLHNKFLDFLKSKICEGMEKGFGTLEITNVLAIVCTANKYYPTPEEAAFIALVLKDFSKEEIELHVRTTAEPFRRKK